MLDSAGCDVAVVTNLETANALARCLPYRAAIVCKHSFAASERDYLVAELGKNNPGLKIVARCPGCLDCDEGRAEVMGTLPKDDDTLVRVIKTVDSNHD